jgi:hypothetical protein
MRNENRKRGVCVNSTAERQKRGKKPYHAPTRREHAILTAYKNRMRERGLTVYV